MKSARFSAAILAVALGSASAAWSGNGFGHGSNPRIIGGDWTGRQTIQDRRTLHTRTQAAETFRVMDRNGDGQLTEDEYMSVQMGGGAGLNGARVSANRTRKEQMFRVLDADGSGTLSAWEFAQPRN